MPRLWFFSFIIRPKPQMWIGLYTEASCGLTIMMIWGQGGCQASIRNQLSLYLDC